MANANESALRKQLAEKDAELRKVREELQKASSHVVELSESTNKASLDNSFSSTGREIDSNKDDKESLRKQLNEAMARWRWEERRAKAREEELESTAKSERNRADAIAKDLEDTKTEISQMKEKVREATRKRAQLQADYTTNKTELDETKAKLSAHEDTIRGLNDEIEQVRVEKAAFEEENAKLIEEVATLKEGIRLLRDENQNLEALAADRESLRAKVNSLETDLRTSEDKNMALKQTMRHNAQLVKDLKAELSRAMMQSHAASSPPSTPSAGQSPPSAPLATRPTSDAPPDSDKLVRDLASRLEGLLTENEALRERVKFLEEIVQGLTRELNTFKDSSPARPTSLRMRKQ